MNTDNYDIYFPHLGIGVEHLGNSISVFGFRIAYYGIIIGIGMLMEHFLDKDFTPKALERAADIRSEEYYINMMTAWFFATALAKQYEAALPYIEDRRLDAWTHNKAIQKSIESRRITDGQKAYLRSLKLK